MNSLFIEHFKNLGGGRLGVNDTIYYFYPLLRQFDSPTLGVNKTIYYFYLLFIKSECLFLGVGDTICYLIFCVSDIGK